MPDLLPSEVRAFLGSGATLKYDASQSAVGQIRLVTPDQLEVVEIEMTSDESDFHAIDPYNFLDGTYRLHAVNLVAESEEYEPTGILGWLPEYQSFGSWDPEHRSVLLFPNVRWADIIAAPAKYLDEQWNRLGIAQPVQMPWLDLSYHVVEFEHIFEPYPKTCSLHRIDLAISERPAYPEYIADLHNAFRLRNIVEYINELPVAFPCAGVPADRSTHLYCSQCFEAERGWLLRASLQEP